LFERPPSCQHFKKNCPESEDVGLGIRLPPLRNLRRRVWRSRGTGAGRHRHEPEPTVCQLDTRRRQGAVEFTAIVEKAQRLREAHRQPKRFRDG
jgi:hypothetical protein